MGRRKTRRSPWSIVFEAIRFSSGVVVQVPARFLASSRSHFFHSSPFLSLRNIDVRPTDPIVRRVRPRYTYTCSTGFYISNNFQKKNQKTGGGNLIPERTREIRGDQLSRTGKSERVINGAKGNAYVEIRRKRKFSKAKCYTILYIEFDDIRGPLK